MNLIIFGAGASYGSDPNNNTPPLGKNLFDALEIFDPVTWGSLNLTWKEKFREDFEPAMKELIDSGLFAAPFQWAMAEYCFTQFKACESNYCINILKAIDPKLKEFTLASLNYDLLIQQSVLIVNIRIKIGSPVDNENQIRLILPHGSSMIYCEGVRGGQGVSFTRGVSTGGKPKLFRDYNHFVQEKTTNVFPPVMSYFEPNKFTVSCANFVKQERDVFKETVLNANKIAIIGMKIHRIDKHIWEPLAETNAEILYVSGQNAKKEFQKWAKENQRAHDSISSRYMDGAESEIIRFFNL